MPLTPSQIGDVLILQTQKTFTVYAVGLISEDHRQDFERHQSDISHMTDIVGALAAARSMLVAGRRIFLRNIDDGEWSEIPASPATRR